MSCCPQSSGKAQLWWWSQVWGHDRSWGLSRTRHIEPWTQSHGMEDRRIPRQRGGVHCRPMGAQCRYIWAQCWAQ
jgi:hypothetical protein